MEVLVENAVRAKKRGPYNVRAVVGLVALCLILFIAAIQFGKEILLSLKAFNMSKGVFGSPWVGFENYRTLLENSDSLRVIANTLIYNFLFAGFSFIISFLYGLIVNSFSKRSIARDTVAVLAMLPVFVPGEVYAAWFIDFFGSLPFTNAGSVRILLPLIASLKYAGIPVLIVHILGILKRDKDNILPVKCAGLFSLAMLSLSGAGHFSLVNQLLNPLVYQSADILDTYSFRTGFMQMNIGVNAAVGVLQVLICIISMAILFVPIKFLYKASFDGEKEYMGRPVPQSVFGAVIALVIFVLLYLSPYLLTGRLSGFYFQTMGAGSSKIAGSITDGTVFVAAPSVIFKWLLVSLTAALICTCIAFIAGGFADGGRTIRKCGAILLAVITLITVQPFSISGYLTIKSFGVINTYMSIIMVSIFSAAAVWAFAAMRADDYMRSSKGLLFSVLAVLLIQLALIYNNGTSALLYLNRPDMSPLLMCKELITEVRSIEDYASRYALAGNLGVSGLMLSLPSILMFLLAKVCLPAEAMLAVIAGGAKQ